MEHVDVRVDVRVASLCRLLSLPVQATAALVYPRMFSLHDMGPEVRAGVCPFRALHCVSAKCAVYVRCAVCFCCALCIAVCYESLCVVCSAMCRVFRGVLFVSVVCWELEFSLCGDGSLPQQRFTVWLCSVPNPPPHPPHTHTVYRGSSVGWPWTSPPLCVVHRWELVIAAWRW
jgi:hypothetical protein